MARPDEKLEIDLSEVTGKTYRCIDNCALCCLCQPELLPEEERAFRADRILSQGVSDKHISPGVRGAAIKLKGGHGSCYFLDSRRCRIYNGRPHFCRAFPINIFIGWRVQAYANLSCRGIGLPGESLEAATNQVLSDIGANRLESEGSQAKNVFTEFIQNTRATWTAQSFSSIREAAHQLQEELVDEIGLGRLFTYAEHGTTRQNAKGSDIAKLVRQTEAAADIQERALIDGTELFDLPDLSLLPIFIDDKLEWQIFKLQDKEIVGYRLGPSGETEEISRTRPDDVHLMPMDREGKGKMLEYLGIVNARDCFLGHAAYLSDADGYEYNFAQVYLGALANNVLDLWWRASFLAGIKGASRIGAQEAREGIIFFDMDLLDLPTIGAFV